MSAYEELKADPSRAITREQVDQALDARRNERIAGRLKGKLKAPEEFNTAAAEEIRKRLKKATTIGESYDASAEQSTSEVHVKSQAC